jgi:hypothetical protein
MDVVDGEWVRWVWGLTCEFAGVFGGVSEKISSRVVLHPFTAA